MIPAFNEESSIAKVIGEIPRSIQGFSRTEVLVIDDGSTDNTVSAAKKAGADKIVRHQKNFGLAVAFRTGLEAALKMGADVIVNTDADFQYNQKQIPLLVKPIVEGKAGIVLTDRNVWKLKHMPFLKKLGNSISTGVTSFASGMKVRDAQSGFRAFSRDAALRINILSNYTHVQETIIQAAAKKIPITQISCEFRKRDGKSRLVKSLFSYAFNAASIIIRTYVQYRPFKAFLELGSAFILAGLLFGFRVIVHFLQSGSVSPFIPSAILSSVLLLMGFQIVVLGLVADSIKSQRQVQEELLYLAKKRELF